MRAASNPGARVAAFFDIDGTLLAPPPLERRFLRYLRWRGAVTVEQAACWLARFLRRACRAVLPGETAEAAWLAATQANKAHLAGISAATAEAFAASLARRPLEFFTEALQRLEWHAAQGHRIFLVSGTLGPLAEAVARQLLLEATACATHLEVAEGRWTGEVDGEAVCGMGKARALERLAAKHRLELDASYAYGNSWSDRWMLERAGHPATVNASVRLARLARQRGWPVLRWREAGLSRGRRAIEANPRQEATETSSGNAALAAFPITASGERKK